MLSAILILGIQSQNQLGPVAPAGSNQRFQSGVAQTTQLLFEGKFTEAEASIYKLPQKAITYNLIEKELSPIQKKMAESALKNAIQAVQSAFPELTFKKVTTKEQIRFDFAESLPIDENSRIPKGAVTFTSLDPSEPAVETVLSLTRLATKVSVEEGHFAQEFFFSIGTYLGLQQTPGMMGISRRTDSLTMARIVVTPVEKGLITENFKVIEELKTAVKNKTKLVPAKIQAHFDQTKWEIGTVTQGDVPQIQIGVHNSGNAPLKFWMEPDCSCFLIRTSGVAQPGETANINIMMDTFAFSGPQLKRIFIFTNDPDRPMTIIPVTTTIRPAYQFIKEGPQTQVEYIEDTGSVITRYFAVSPGQDIKIHDVKVNGVNATATFESWKGELPDPNNNEPPQPRNGYKITVLIAPDGIKGKVDATLVVTTNNEDFKSLLHGFSVQKGIASNPTILYFGDLATGHNTRAWAILSQPGKPFKIEKAVSNHKNFNVTVEPMPNGEYKLVVEYDGKGLAGQFASSIQIFTDSKDSPMIEIPIQGFVK